MTLPNYINCNETEIVHCDYFLTKDCKNTCGYALDIGFIGADQAPRREITKKLCDILFLEDMRDY